MVQGRAGEDTHVVHDKHVTPNNERVPACTADLGDDGFTGGRCASDTFMPPNLAFQA